MSTLKKWIISLLGAMVLAGAGTVATAIVQDYIGRYRAFKAAQKQEAAASIDSMRMSIRYLTDYVTADKQKDSLDKMEFRKLSPQQLKEYLTDH